MRLHRFYIGAPADEAGQSIPGSGEIVISDPDLVHQLKRVFRFISGDRVILFDGSGFDYVSEIVSLEKEKVTFNVLEKQENKNVPRCEIYLFASLIKNSNYELVLEKCTELGVAHFVPIISERSEKKNLNYDRARKIVKEASEQSGRGTLPELHETLSLSEVFSKFNINFVAFDSCGETLGRDNFKFLPAQAGQISNVQNLKANSKNQKAGLLIGPEGGWSEKEIALFKEKNIPIYSLGTQTLRAETASIVASAFLLL